MAMRRDDERIGVDYPTPTGGTFFRPGVLPPPTEYKIQASISAFTNGGATINDAWVIDVNNNRVNTLTPGSKFTIRVNFVANNNTGVLTLWSACVTAIDETRQIRNFAIARPIAPDRSIKGNLTLDWLSPGYNIMPGNDLTLSIKVFGNDSATISTPPAVSAW